MDPSAATQPSSRYVRDFESLFVPIGEDILCDKARNGKLRHCQFRSLCWRYFLNCLPKNRDQWLESCIERRHQYDIIKARHLLAKERDDQKSTTTDQLDVASKDGGDNNRLENSVPKSTTTTAAASTTTATLADSKNKEPEDEQQYIRATNQCDHRNVFRTIERDVVRTFPDMEFFRQSEMQAILENVLFNYASEHPHLSYKQGMHELLATLLYVLHTDSQNCLINNEGGLANETIATLLDLRYLEHDVYHLFCALMKSIESWYQNDEIVMLPSPARGLDELRGRGSGGSINKSSRRQQQVESVLGNKLKMISENIVRNSDLELFNHLEALQIAPQIYGIRWMRLLFGREFEFLDLLTVWDALICDRDAMSLTDYIFASMLLTIREKLVNGDYTDCLNSLMRHQFKDAQFVIKLALHLREPHNYPKPRTFQIRSQPQLFGSGQKQHNRFSAESLLATKLSQQYLNVKQQFQLQVSGRTRSPTVSSLPTRGQQPSAPSSSSSGGGGSDMRRHGQRASNSESGSRKLFAPNQQQPRRTSFDQGFTLINPIKEYEMREMQSTSSSNRIGSAFRPQLGNLAANQSLNMSTESYDDLHSIVDYCWRLLSDQIDSLQRCLPKEKSLDSEDEIFVALAQLKKVRDVLKGSLRLEDELETLPGVNRNSQRK